MTAVQPLDHLNQSALEHIRTDFVRISAHQTIGEALAQVQREGKAQRIVYFYVVDDEDRLIGVVPTRRLLLNPPDTRIEDVMVHKVVALPESATVLEACEFFIMHRLLALPVVDSERRIIGVIDVELYASEISDVTRYEESEDVFQLIGVRLAQVQQAHLPTAFARRFPWLLCNIAGGLLCAFITSLFQDVLDKVLVLALFIPVVLALAESMSIQSLTLSLQMQHGTRVNFSSLFRSLVREVPIGALIGIASGCLVGGVALFWQGIPAVALSILLSMAFSIVTAAALGILIPGILGLLQRDPKVASGPVVLALADTATLCYYFGFATWWLA
ncbi:MAG: magnesium transporter [Pirellulales bacterium]